MSQNLFFLDVETTGFSPKKHEIFELAFFIESHGHPFIKMDLYIRPEKWENIDPKALKVNGWTVERLKKLPDKIHAVNTFTHCAVPGYPLSIVEYGNKFDTNFFIKFLKENALYRPGVFREKSINVLQLARKKLDLQSYTLENVARRLGIAVSPRRIHTGGYDRDLLIEIYGRLR